MKKLSQGLALLLACILLFQCGISSVYAEDILPDGSDAGSANISVDADKDDQQPEDEQQGDTPDEDDQKPEDEQQGDTPDEDDQKPEDEQQGDTPDKDDQQPEDEQQGDTPDESDQQPEDEQKSDTPDEDDQQPEDEQQGDTPDESDQPPEDELSAVPMLLGAAPPAQSNGGIGQWGTSSQADGDGVHLIVGWYEPDGDKSKRPPSVDVTVYWKTPDHVIHTGKVTLGKDGKDTDVDTMERNLGEYNGYRTMDIDRWKTWPNYTPEGSTTPQGKDHQKGVTYEFPNVEGYNVKIIDGDCGVIYIKAEKPTTALGSITIDKQTVGEVGTPENAVFVVTDFNTGEVKETIKYSDFTQVGNDEDHRQYTLENLPLGTYKITERGAEQNGYVLTVKGSKAGHNDIQYENDNSSENKGKFEWNSGPEASANNNNSKGEDIAYIRNTYTPAKTSIGLTAQKDYDGPLEAGQFTFKLMEGNVQLSTATNDADGSIEFPMISYNEAGTYTYTISEVAGNDDAIIYDSKSYNVTVTVKKEGETLTATATYPDDGITFKNTYNRTTSVSGRKTWDDNNNQDGIRPTSITIRLYADGVEKKSQTVSAANGWKWSFTDLPMYKVSEDGEKRKINYSISEDLVNNYTSAVNGYDVTNTHTPETTSVNGSKTWNDNNNQDGIRPTSITINLLANEEKIASKEVTADDGWTWSFTDLPVYKAGQKITYSIKEDEVTGYTSVVSGYNVTNTHTPEKTSVNGSKKWEDNDNQDGKRPESITIRLLANGEEKDYKTVSADDGWSWTFDNLDKYANGREITYSISEDQVDNYTSVVKDYNVTNSYTPEKTSITGSKKWNDNDDQDGIRPESITIRLYAGDQQVRSQTVTADTNGNWSWTFANLDKYANGKLITYSIKEDAVTGYTSVVSGYNVTNTHTPEKTSVTGTKTWNDNNDQDGMRPESITIRLYADGVEVDSKEVKATDNWSWTFDDLDKYADGKEITYTITEDEVEDYTAEIDGYDVTNTYDPVMPFSHDGNGGRKTGVTPEPSKTPETSAASHAGVETPTTGDTSALGAWSFSAAMALALLAVVVWRKRANDRRRDEMQ